MSLFQQAQGELARWDTQRRLKGGRAGTLLCYLQMNSQDTGGEITSQPHRNATYCLFSLPLRLKICHLRNKANGTIIESRRFSPYVVIIFLFSNSNQPSVRKNRLRERLTE